MTQLRAARVAHENPTHSRQSIHLRRQFTTQPASTQRATHTPAISARKGVLLDSICEYVNSSEEHRTKHRDGIPEHWNTSGIYSDASTIPSGYPATRKKDAPEATTDKKYAPETENHTQAHTK